MLCASKERFTKERCRIMMESMRNSLRDVARRDIVIASVVSVLGLALM
jgi:hypothetical protein